MYEVDEVLLRHGEKSGHSLRDREFAEYMDDNDALAPFRKMFHIPRNDTLMGGMCVTHGDLICMRANAARGVHASSGPVRNVWACMQPHVYLPQSSDAGKRGCHDPLALW